MAKTPKAKPTPKPAPAPARPAAGPSLATRSLRTVTLRVGAAAVLAAGGAALVYYKGGSPAPAVKRDAPAAISPVKPPPQVAVLEPSPVPTPPPSPEPREMSASQRAAFDLWLAQTYRKCWTAPKTLPEGQPYLAKVRIAFKADGGLAGPPKLVNPPSDPAWRPHADAAIRAVKGCDPLRVPEKYAVFYPAWKTRTVYFDPAQ